MTAQASGDWLPRSLRDEPLDALIAGGEAAGIHQFLPDRHGVAATGEPDFDGVAMHRRTAEFSGYDLPAQRNRATSTDVVISKYVVDIPNAGRWRNPVDECCFAYGESRGR